MKTAEFCLIQSTTIILPKSPIHREKNGITLEYWRRYSASMYQSNAQHDIRNMLSNV